MVRVRSIAALLSQWRSVFSASKPVTSEHLELGRRGEDLAAQFLRKHGYKILHRNFRATGGGEADIVCRDRAENTLVFIEVKARSSIEFGNPSDAVTLEKQHLISRAALSWLRMLDNPKILVRFDVVEVLFQENGPTISLIRNAFQLSEPFIH